MKDEDKLFGKKSNEISFNVKVTDEGIELLRDLATTIPKGEETLSVRVTLPSGEVKIFHDCSFVISKDKRSLEWFNEEGHGMVRL